MRLYELYINNFKFFPKQGKNSPLLKIEGRNILIYGENGSGKSSIYWAVYTLLESSFKKNSSDVQKYFIKGGEHSLVNINARKSDNSYIKAILKDSSGGLKEYLVNGEKTSVDAIRANSAIRESGMASDFINYRVLFRLHLARHSESNNLFPWFEHEILPYIRPKIESFYELSKIFKGGLDKVKDINGNDVYPNQTMRLDPNPAISKYYKIYESFIKGAKRWNTDLKNYLKKNSIRANEILINDFKQDFEFSLEYLDSKVSLSASEFSYTPPEINIKIKRYNGKRVIISKPHSFLNEAKWTCIGLSIRFAIIEDWTFRPVGADLKCLILDDMLIGLDMSNREIVMDLLLSRYVNDYQIILMTHDRFFFELIRNRINSSGNSGSWKILEMYEDEGTGKPQPLIIESVGKISKAKSFYKSKDFSSSANMIRQASEKLCKNYLTNQEQLGGDYRPMSLDGMLQKLITKGTTNGLDVNLLQDLKDYKDRIMNPSSHYDIDTPLFKAELFKAISTLEKISTLLAITI